MLSGLLLASFTAAAVADEQAGATPAIEAADPVEDLRNRSPENYWDELNALWDNVKPEEAVPQTPPEQDGPLGNAPAPFQLPIDADVAQPTAQTPTRVAAHAGASVPVRYAAQLGQETPSQPYTEVVRDPSQLKKLTDILPYDDYEPNPDIRDSDACENLCPRPDGLDCKVYEDGRFRPECPEEVRLSEGAFEGRLLPETVFTWEASNLYHQPLYFEDPQLERYGHTHGHCVQPFISGGRFMTQLMGLPYQMTLHPLCAKRYTLGWYRPGECAPKQIYQIPLNLHAAAVTAAFYTGMIYAVP